MSVVSMALGFFTPDLWGLAQVMQGVTNDVAFNDVAFRAKHLR